MKRNVVYAIVFLILVAVAVILYYSQKTATIPKPRRDFAVEDTASVTRVFMVNKANEQVLLERKDGYWLLNNEYFARKDLVNLLLKTINRLRVKAPVSKSAHDNVVRLMATTSTKVEIYTDNEQEPAKVFYVGHATQDNMGTYMLLENSSEPFIMHIPGFTGYLTSRFSVLMPDWRDRSIFMYGFNDISSVTIEYPGETERSFRAVNYGDNKFDLIPMDSNNKISGFDTLKVKTFLASFKKVSCEYFVTKFDKHKKDSVLSTQPKFIITVEDRNGTKRSVTAFPRPNLSGLLDEEGKEYEFDIDRMYGFINGNIEMVVIQYFVFDPLCLSLDDFIGKKIDK